MAMLQSMTAEEQILYWLWLDLRVRALADRLLERFAVEDSMNTLIANQYGRVQGEAGGCGLTLCVTAQTPRRESVGFETRVDSVEQLSICLRSCGPGESRTGHQRILTSWEYRTRSPRPPRNLIRRDSFFSTTCRIRRDQQPAMPTKPQLNDHQRKLEVVSVRKVESLPSGVGAAPRSARRVVQHLQSQSQRRRCEAEIERARRGRSFRLYRRSTHASCSGQRG